MATSQLVVLPVSPNATVQVWTPVPHALQASPQVAFADAFKVTFSNGWNGLVQVPGPMHCTAADGLVDITVPPVVMVTVNMAVGQPTGGDGLKKSQMSRSPQTITTSAAW